MSTYREPGEKKLVHLEDLRDFIKEAINEALKELKSELRKDEKPLSIEQVTKRYGVSKATVHKWKNKGWIEGYKVGKCRYFTLQELESNLTAYKFGELLHKTGAVPKTNKIY